MFYHRNTDENLTRELFQNPSSEYRGAPFWAWNCALDLKETVAQTSIFKEMGFGGYHTHVRHGLDTPYLGEEFNACIKACAKEAKRADMLLYLYDEDCWPSGGAGGSVTKNKRFSARYLLFTTQKAQKAPSLDTDGKLLEGQKLLARYTVRALGNKLISYRRLSKQENPFGTIWYAYLKTEAPRGFLNNEPYVDTLNKDAIDRFAEITYGSYKKTVGGFYGKEIKTMFTDEPQFHRFKQPLFPLFYRYEERAWTDDFDDTFKTAYRYSILDRLPELFWEPRYNRSQARYHYFDHLSERFANAFADNLGNRCKKDGIALTGHLMEEPKLDGQTKSAGDAMRQYRGFEIPGIDILNSRYEFTTAKQAQSAMRQYGREAMLSELYGVSRWDNDFKNYKVGGDWQAALGVTVRVPHLSLMSMKGQAKRDYPASIFYQSPWYKKFKFLEDHFARVNTALTRGNPLTEIAVVHPIESYWLLYGDSAVKAKRNEFDKKFAQITDILLRGGLDFDFICEATFPELTKEGTFPLQVGKMQYKTVVVPNCITLRSSTIDRLTEFQKNGGKVIFVGEIPQYEDGKRSSKPQELADISTSIPFVKKKILAALEPNRLYGTYEAEKHTENVICQLREDNEGLWLFAARAETSKPKPYASNKQELTLKIKGEWKATKWNTLNGEITALKTKTADGITFISAEMYNQDSLLLRLDDKDEDNFDNEIVFTNSTPVEKSVKYTLSEPNALLLDTAYYSLDKEKYSARKCELLRLDNLCRKKCNFPIHKGKEAQPWASEKREPEHTLQLKFVFNSKIEINAPYIALEEAEKANIMLNGKGVESKVCGWYVDKAIKKVALPSIKKGKNILEISIPFGLNTNVEWCYLLGGFGVALRGSCATLTALPERLRFSDITKQGLPFYGGEINYISLFEGNGKPACITVPKFKSAVLEVVTTESKDIAFAPHSAILPTANGTTKLNITAYISRHNAFGPIHARSAKTRNTSPHTYYSSRIRTTKNYVITPAGILVTPEIKLQ